MPTRESGLPVMILHTQFLHYMCMSDLSPVCVQVVDARPDSVVEQSSVVGVSLWLEQKMANQSVMQGHKSF